MSPVAALAAAQYLRNHDQRDPSLVQIGNLDRVKTNQMFSHNCKMGSDIIIEPIKAKIAGQRNQNLEERTMQQLLASAHGSLFVFVLLQQHFWEVSQ
jgi:hypothetical protein